MTHHPTALAGSVPAVAVSDLVAIVDELTVASADTIDSTRIRIPLLSALRDEKGASLGSTGTGRSTGRGIPLSVEAMAVWSQVTTIICDLHEQMNGQRPRTGSIEQILTAWMRDVAAADADARMRQYSQHVPEIGLNQDALRDLLNPITWIRDRIVQLLDPIAAGDIPTATCPICGKATITIWRDGDWEQMPAMSFTRDRDGIINRVLCRNPDCRTGWEGWDGLQTLRRQVELRRMFGAQDDARLTDQPNGGSDAGSH